MKCSFLKIMGNMINRKFIITTVLSAFLVAGNSVMADSSDLLRMDVKKSSSDDTVDVTFYTTGAPTNTVVTRKSGNTYVVLLPNVAGNQSIVPALGGVKDLVSDVRVKNVDDGIGGYTKVTFNTTKPIKIQTYTKRTAPLTKAQQDYKNLIAQNSKFDPNKKMENFKKTSSSVSTTVNSNVKPAVSTTKTTVTKSSAATTKTTTKKPVEANKVTAQTTQPKTTTQNANKIALKSVAVHVPVIKADSIKSSAQSAKVQPKTVKTEAVKPKIEVKSEVKPAQKVESKPEAKSVEFKPVPAFDLKNPPAQSKNVQKDNSKTIEKIIVGRFQVPVFTKDWDKPLDNLANEMMKLESSLMRDTLETCWTFGWTVINIHDALLMLDTDNNKGVTVEGLEFVVKDVFAKRGLFPCLSVENAS